jgi:hypothetical protein
MKDSKIVNIRYFPIPIFKQGTANSGSADSGFCPLLLRYLFAVALKAFDRKGGSAED